MSEMFNPDTYCWYAYSAYDNNTKSCCCMFTGQAESFHELNQDPEILQIRQDLRNGVKSPTCWRCWQTESHGEASTRHTGLLQAKRSMPNGNYFDVKLRSMWIDSGTVCNLACRTCSYRWSSTLYREHRDRWGIDKLPIIQKTNVNALLEEDYSEVRTIHVIGGEPFLNLDHVTVLEKIAVDGHAKNCKITYVTNGTLPVPDRLLAIIPQFKEVNFAVSIDGTHDCFEYVRTGSQWSQFVDNIDYMKKVLPSNSQIFFHITISALNVLYLTDALSWIGTQIGHESLPLVQRVNRLFNKRALDTTVILTPEHYTFAIFTDQQRQQVLDSLRDTDYRINNVINYLNNAKYQPKLIEKFWQEVAWTEQYKGKSISQYLPRLDQLLRS